MYRLPLLTVILFISFVAANAQRGSYFNQPDKNGEDKIFFTGIVAGINAAQIDGDTYAGFHKAGLNAGFVSFVKFSPKVLGSIELLYSQKGARNATVINSPAVGSVPIIYTAKLNYVEIPLTLDYLVADKILFGLGLSYSRLISDKEEMDSYTGAGTSTLENTYRKQDINYLLAVSYQLSGNLFARARYQYSMLSIRDAQKIPIQFGTPRQFNNLFALQFFLVF